ncbi:hypothetical protein NDN08_002775 [Rhodosorus marinus]|uniref:Uncharacterized protein n=1 Tax=Rhodosorus marinus TaxID=101924 RepID=A0AAV8UZ33_9RHOD|nr:hypothetical protein NDN08_002775 [Rhodosorus marinus]
MKAKCLFRVVGLLAILCGCFAAPAKSTQLQDEHLTRGLKDGTLASNLPERLGSDDPALDGVYPPQLDALFRAEAMDRGLVAPQYVAALKHFVEQTFASHDSLESELNAANARALRMESELKATITRVKELEAGTDQTVNEEDARLEDKFSQEFASANANAAWSVGTPEVKLDQEVARVSQGLTNTQDVSSLLSVINSLQNEVASLSTGLSTGLEITNAKNDASISRLETEVDDEIDQLLQKVADLEIVVNSRPSLDEVLQLIGELETRLTSKLDSSGDIARIDAEILAIVDLQSQSMNDISGITARIDGIESQVGLNKAEVEEQVKALADTDASVANLKTELDEEIAQLVQNVTDLGIALNGRPSLGEMVQLIGELETRLTSKLDSTGDIARIDDEILTILDLQSKSMDDISGITARIDGIGSQVGLNKAEVEEQLKALAQNLKGKVSKARLRAFVTELREGLAKCVLKKRFQ